MTSLKQQATRGAIWTLGGYGANQALRLANNLILTRLLLPEHFGLMALVNTLRIGFELFSDLGIGQSIIQNRRGAEPDFYNTAWSVQVVRGIILWFGVLIATWPVAQFYDDDRLLWLLPLVGFTTVIDGFRSTSVFVLSRRIQIGKLTIFELLAQFGFLAIMVLWAIISPGILALAAGTVAGSALRTLGSFFLIKEHRNHFLWKKDVLDEIVKFGRWMFLATALMFAGDQADRIILGKLLDFKILGIYAIAFTMADFPKSVIRMLGSRIIFPVISRQADLPRPSLRSKFLNQRRKVLLGGVVLLALMTVCGDWIIGLLYDDRYRDAQWMMPILCAGTWFSILFHTIAPTLLGIGKPMYSAQGNFARFLTIAVFLPLGFYSMAGNLTLQLITAIVIVASSDLLPLIVISIGLHREGLGTFWQDWNASLLFFLSLGALVLLRYSAGLGLPIDTLITR